MPEVTLQGVLSPKDARSAVDAGVDGLVLSNHGGRQLDHSPAPLDMIASVRRAIGHRVPLLMDGGIRRGTDVLKVGVTNLLTLGAHQKSCLTTWDHLHFGHPHLVLCCVCADTLGHIRCSYRLAISNCCSPCSACNVLLCSTSHVPRAQLQMSLLCFVRFQVMFPVRSVLTICSLWSGACCCRL